MECKKMMSRSFPVNERDSNSHNKVNAYTGQVKKNLFFFAKKVSAGFKNLP